jgi:hypothetical protein
MFLILISFNHSITTLSLLQKTLQIIDQFFLYMDHFFQVFTLRFKKCTRQVACQLPAWDRRSQGSGLS